LLFTRLGHGVWPVIAIAEAVALVFMATGIRNPQPAAAPAAPEPAGAAGTTEA
jgi:hypothetical protein